MHLVSVSACYYRAVAQCTVRMPCPYMAQVYVIVSYMVNECAETQYRVIILVEHTFDCCSDIMCMVEVIVDVVMVEAVADCTARL